MPGYAAALAALPDAALETLLELRPDLRAGQPPASFAELASRAGSPASLQAALATMDAGSLQLAELLALIGVPTSVDRLAEAAGPGLDRARLHELLATLAQLGLALPGPDGDIAGPPGLAAAFDRPGRLGPPIADLAKVGVSRDQLARAAAALGVEPGNGGASAGKADLVRAVSAALADPAIVLAALEPAGQGARELLARARQADGPVTLWTAGPAHHAGEPDAQPTAWLTERGLLLPVTYSQFTVPREAELALRGGWVFPDWPAAPALPAPEPAPVAADEAGAAAHRFVLAAEAVAGELDTAPLELIRSGTVGVRDLRRLARSLELGEGETGFLLDLLVAAGLAVAGGPWGSRSLALTPAADTWLAATRSERWAALALAWRAAPIALEEHLADPELRVTGEAPRPLALPRTARAVERRRAVMEVLALVPEANAVPAATIGPVVRWRRPLLWRGADAQVEAVLAASALLGQSVAALLGRAAPGLGLPAWLAGADRATLAAEAGVRVMPDGAREFLVAGDLTVIAPGGLAPDLEARLGSLAERQPGGGWRIDQASLRRAFDTGTTASELLAFLGRHSRTPLPQALAYLVTDVEREHGRLRVGTATTYLRGDPASVAGLVRSAAGRRLGLREVGPGVAVSAKSRREVLAALRKAGQAPVAEEADGSTRTEAPKPVRHPPRPAGAVTAERRPEPASSTPADLVARLRATDPGAAAAEPVTRGPGSDGLIRAPAEAAALCQRAAEAGSAVEIAYAGLDGETVRVIEPLRVQAGRVQAFCRLRQAERTFVLSRISWARPYPEPAARPAPESTGG